MQQEKIITLLEKYANGNITGAEQQELADHIHTMDNSSFQLLMDRYEQTVQQAPSPGAPDMPLLHSIKDRIAAIEGSTQPVLNWRRYAAAAAVVVLLGTAAGYFFSRQPSRQGSGVTGEQLAAAGIQPGGNKAVLTLANGETIVLDDAKEGPLGQQGNTRVIKLNSGQLAYTAANGADAGKVLYNTIATPRGGQFQVVLPDGSKVWLNAASSLRYPTSFHGEEREVELNGEAYFEISSITVTGKNGQAHKKPFRVKTGNMAVEVLGTHFNVAGYADEQAIKTTLTEGSVKLVSGSASTLIKPGYQGILTASARAFEVVPANIDETLAWKNGNFCFNKADIQTIMRQIARWYDVEVVYEGVPTEREFVGTINRQEKLSKVLRLLELSNVHFRIEGRKIIVVS